jgi:hypothetical protein
MQWDLRCELAHCNRGEQTDRQTNKRYLERKKSSFPVVTMRSVGVTKERLNEIHQVPIPILPGNDSKTQGIERDISDGFRLRGEVERNYIPKTIFERILVRAGSCGVPHFTQIVL